MPQMSFAQIGTLYNSISNELEGGVTPQNQQLLLQQVSTVQTQLQGLINNGTFNNFVDPNTGNPTIVHAQNIADQMSFLSQQISTFGQNNATPQPKFINDVVRDVQDIVQTDPNLAGLANQNGHIGFQQVSNLLTPPAPFPDTPMQTAVLNQFVTDSNNLATSAMNAAAGGFDPATVQPLIAQIQQFTAGANAYVNDPAQAGVFAARFQNEFASHGVQGTASADLINGLMNHDANLVNGAATVLKANANDVTGNMLQSGQTFAAVPNGGIPTVVDNVHTAGMVFDDAVTKLIGGVYSGNQASIVNDLNATQTGLQKFIANNAGITGSELKDLQNAVSLLGQESHLVSAINTAQPTHVSGVNGQIANLQSQILNTINSDPALAAAAVGADGTTGFIPLPSTDSSPADNNPMAAVPATPATPAVPTVTAAVPATPAVPGANHLEDLHLQQPHIDLTHHIFG
jgi:hypothetical protein